ncbi:MAG TPA: acetyltransferase [Phaeodactylibacter sp.]|nr:acetyltransferase [Phaeodactylibacter sp.]
MQLASYIFFRVMVALFSVIPFGVLYRMSDGLKFLFLRVLKYRYAVIKQNLNNAFPQKNESEIETLIEKTYQNLCDILLEGIKGMSLSDAEVMKRYVFVNPEVADAYYEKGQNIIGMASHYGNWEWAVQAISLQLKHITVGVVARIKNKYLDAYVQKYRTHENVMVLYPDLAREVIENWDKRPALFVYIADQSPPRNAGNKAQWVQFLNQDTACLWGGDRMARRMGYPVLNMAINRIKRGFYEVRFDLITDDAQGTSDGEITENYMRRLEQQIIAKPQDWLWSHKRWKISKATT